METRAQMNHGLSSHIFTFVKIHFENIHLFEPLFEFILGTGGNGIHIFVFAVIILNGMGVKDLNLQEVMKIMKNREVKETEFHDPYGTCVPTWLLNLSLICLLGRGGKK